MVTRRIPAVVSAWCDVFVLLCTAGLLSLWILTRSVVAIGAIELEGGEKDSGLALYSLHDVFTDHAMLGELAAVRPVSRPIRFLWVDTVLPKGATGCNGARREGRKNKMEEATFPFTCQSRVHVT